MRNLALVALWSGRVLAVGLVALWGAFFFEHLGWFLHPGAGLPPPKVWLLQFAHLSLLAGLLLLLRWEVAGSALTIASALGFFAVVAGRQFPLFFGVTILPAVLILLGRYFLHRAAVPSPTP